jgi:hypothetical protein
MGFLFYPRKQTSVSDATDCDVIVCYGAAKLADKHLASKIHCVDEIIGWLERRRRDRSPQIEKVRLSPIYPALICSCSILESH